MSGQGYALVLDGLYAGKGCIELSSVDAVVCLDPSCRVSVEGAREYCHPIIDGTVESLGEFAAALSRVVELLRGGHRVYVHCMAGCGRTGTLVSSYLILEEGYSAEEAIAYYTSRRGCGPETWEQVEFLYALSHVAIRSGSEAAWTALRESGSLEEFFGRAESLAPRSP